MRMLVVVAAGHLMSKTFVRLILMQYEATGRFSRLGFTTVETTDLGVQGG